MIEVTFETNSKILLFSNYCTMSSQLPFPLRNGGGNSVPKGLFGMWGWQGDRSPTSVELPLPQFCTCWRISGLCGSRSMAEAPEQAAFTVGKFHPFLCK